MYNLLKSRIHIILPIAVALILPAPGYLSSAATEPDWGSNPLVKWAMTSLVLYILWFYIWKVSKSSLSYKNLLIILIPIAFLGAGHWFSQYFEISPGFEFHYLIRMMFAVALIVIIQFAIRTQQNNSRLLLEREQLQTEHYRTKLKALHSKVDPHFLFNSLNTLRSMVDIQHENSNKFISSLSEFYRQTLKYNEDSTIPLKEELGVLKSYLFVMKSRNEKAMSVEYNIDTSSNQLHIPVLALQIVVENCFKHNSMTTKMPLHILIRTINDDYIEVKNNIQAKIDTEEPSGFGLDLLEKRYELMNEKNGIRIDQTSEYYAVKLKLLQP